ncbi:uncharacterized protein LMH87_007807 [Akanthomyces muscarius]|uniref:Uncharacterized protein n=1 Tax=Akanthomyces muscarius TaxID=2231603 RepID=A0A9W8UR62_AKAMU|nr:uncharacterized protein LMH87_007807 [Akanthomyces muscarius]KAJ4159869.1 hypothetical protein LMH87_007807 [Akanthomyces muscarius]
MPSPGQNNFAWQHAADARHSLSACVTYPVGEKEGSGNLFAPVPTRHVRPKLPLVDITHSCSDNVNGTTQDISLLPKSALKRSYSVGSLLDYTRASKWLREMLWYPETYTTKLTSRSTRFRPRSQSLKIDLVCTKSWKNTLMTDLCQDQKITLRYTDTLLSNFQPPQWERMATSLSRCGLICTAQRILKVLGVASELLRHPTKQRLTQYHKVVFSLATSSFQSGILQGDNCLSTT